jgi:hypothetical protein
MQSDPCVRLKSYVATGTRAKDVYFSICFDSQERLKYVVSPGYSMTFNDFRKFGKKEAVREYADDPESGTHLVGKVDVLEEISKSTHPELFAPLPTTDDRFTSVLVSTQQLEKLTADIPPIAWPTIRSGNAKGNLVIYISVDSEGKIREAWPLNGDNGELHDLLRDQAKHWQIKPAVDPSGKPIQIEGSLSVSFETRLGKPLPIVTGTDIQKQVDNCPYNPVLPSGILARGKTAEVDVGVDVSGKIVGASFSSLDGWNVYQKSGLASKDCRFKPFLEDGKPTYYGIHFLFTAP